MRRLRLSAFGVLSLLAGSAASGAPAPSFELGRGQFLYVKALPAILSDKAVGPQLKNGLTTTFAVAVKTRDFVGRELAGGAQIDVRYDLWDEVFRVEGRGADGSRLAESLPSLERLLAWWQGLKLPVLGMRNLSLPRPWKIEVELGVIPFSRAEQRDTQRWLNRSLRQPASGKVSPPAEGGGGAGPAPAPAPGNVGVLDLLVATSIQRRSYLSYAWTVEFSPER